ncbi:hypothetical protein RCC89_14225 [Cytophagaceae bacterium ABcell3]|nr:hypothetical protein RCC89_14225 [Cytophagaceae bacterium ABcell3]
MTDPSFLHTPSGLVDADGYYLMKQRNLTHSPLLRTMLYSSLSHADKKPALHSCVA